MTNTVSLPVAKRLSEKLGKELAGRLTEINTRIMNPSEFPIKTFFIWYRHTRKGPCDTLDWSDWTFGAVKDIMHIQSHYTPMPCFEVYAAPTLSELLALLPTAIGRNGHEYLLAIDMHNREITYDSGCCSAVIIQFDKVSIQDATAKLVMWCVDEGYIGGADG
jgi:hypothetical protein